MKYYSLDRWREITINQLITKLAVRLFLYIKVLVAWHIDRWGASRLPRDQFNMSSVMVKILNNCYPNYSLYSSIRRRKVQFITLNYLAFQSFDFERTWWRLFQKRVVCTKFDIYVFMYIWTMDKWQRKETYVVYAYCSLSSHANNVSRERHTAV